MNNTIKKILTSVGLFLFTELFIYVPIELFHLNISRKYIVWYHFIIDIIIILSIYLFYKKELNEKIKTYFANFKTIFSKTFTYYVIGYAGLVLSNRLIGILFPTATPVNNAIVEAQIYKYPLYMAFSTIIYAPFIEEIIFRKSVYDIIDSCNFKKYKHHIYILISSLIFAALHLIPSKSLYDCIYIIPYLSISIALSYTYAKTENVASTIVLHALHNTLAFLVLTGGI